MNHLKPKNLSAFACLFAGLVLSGCHKKTPAPPPPPPPPPAAPSASISVSPVAIEPGQSATLTWHSSNATDASITGLGTVDPNGSRSVSPASSQSYTLTARGAGGSVQESARLTVNQPPPPPPAAPAAPSLTDEQLFAQNVKDVFFDYDKYSLRSQDASVVDADASFLTQHPGIKLVIEGHCDERGSEEYNIALGQSRAESLQKAFADHGVDASRIRVISLGKEKPFCTESNEACWQQNRRDHLRLDQ